MRRITVLIVDDSTAIRDGLQSILEAQHDIEVIGVASHGREALDRLHDLDPDIALVDSQMPELDGAALIRQLRKMGSRTRVLFLTVHPAHLQRGLDAGADAALLKDVGREELLRTLRRLANDGARAS